MTNLKNKVNDLIRDQILTQVVYQVELKPWTQIDIQLNIQVKHQIVWLVLIPIRNQIWRKIKYTDLSGVNK